MTNTDLLEQKIKGSGFKTCFVMKKLDLSYQGLKNKLDGKSEFTVSEAAILKSLLNLSNEEMQSIFFATNVA